MSTNLQHSHRPRSRRLPLARSAAVAATGALALSATLATVAPSPAQADSDARLTSAVWIGPTDLVVSGSGIDTGQGKVQVRNGGLVIGQSRFSDIGPGGTFHGQVVTDQCFPSVQYSSLVFDGLLTENGGAATPLPHCRVTPLASKWVQEGGPSGYLGYPTASVTLTPNFTGAYLPFQGRTIYWSSSTGAHLVLGHILDTWAGLGRERSGLGFPTSDEASSATANGRYQQFQHGTILWQRDASHAYAVQGTIKAKWAALGHEAGFLGYPLTNQLTTPDGYGRYNHFQGGSVYWTAATGAHEVHGAIYARWAGLGWERSALGYPTSDQQSLGGTAATQSFQHGYVTLSSSGVVTVHLV